MNASTTQPVTWWNWTALALIAAAAMAIGAIAARLVGFPFYPGEQGVLAQQPYTLAAMSLLVMIVSVVVTTILALLLTRPMDPRAGVAIGLLALAGFSLRGGTMGSVMLASDGAQVFWLLAGEMALLSLLAWACFSQRARLGFAGEPWEGTATDRTTAGVQLLAFLLAMWILGRSTDKGQAIGAVAGAGILSSVLTRLLIGRVWTQGWSVPLIGGVIGYIANAVFASNVDIALLSGPAAGWGIALPLDYVAFGPAGVLLGELLHGHRHPEPIPAT